MDRARGPCVVVAVGQLATLALTWPLFGARATPPLLPAIDLPVGDLAALPIWVLVAGSLAALVWRPIVGGPLHLATVLAAALLDTTRFTPPVLSLAILGLSASRPALHGLGRAHLSAMWLWAGAHKLLSPAYFAVLAPALSSHLPDVGPLRDHAGLSVALIELALGVVSLVPRAARVVGPLAALLHLSALATLLALDMNSGVWAWNLALAALAPSFFSDAGPGSRPASAARPRSELAFQVVLLGIPALSYVAPLHPTLAHHLYSGATPTTLTCGADGCTPDVELRVGMDAFGLPIPPSIGTLEAHFFATCAPGDRWLARSRLRGPRYGEVIAEAECAE